jgi:hypothetical protein
MASEMLLERPLEMVLERSMELTIEMIIERLTEMLMEMVFMRYYRFLKIIQFARISCLFLLHTREVLRGMLYRRFWCGPPAIFPLLFS